MLVIPLQKVVEHSCGFMHAWLYGAQFHMGNVLAQKRRKISTQAEVIWGGKCGQTCMWLERKIQFLLNTLFKGWYCVYNEAFTKPCRETFQGGGAKWRKAISLGTDTAFWIWRWCKVERSCHCRLCKSWISCQDCISPLCTTPKGSFKGNSNTV